MKNNNQSIYTELQEKLDKMNGNDFDKWSYRSRQDIAGHLWLFIKRNFKNELWWNPKYDHTKFHLLTVWYQANGKATLEQIYHNFEWIASSHLLIWWPLTQWEIEYELISNIRQLREFLDEKYPVTEFDKLHIINLQEIHTTASLN